MEIKNKKAQKFFDNLGYKIYTLNKDSEGKYNIIELVRVSNAGLKKAKKDILDGEIILHNYIVSKTASEFDKKGRIKLKSKLLLKKSLKKITNLLKDFKVKYYTPSELENKMKEFEN